MFLPCIGSCNLAVVRPQPHGSTCTLLWCSHIDVSCVKCQMNELAGKLLAVFDPVELKVNDCIL